MKSCLICDDHQLVREALTGTVRLSWPGTTIREAGDFGSAWRLAEFQPDLCLADLVMPGASPLDGIRRLMQIAPNTPVLVVTGNEEDDLLLELLNLGVAGFAPKSATGAVIEAAIKLVLAGGRYLPTKLLNIAMSRQQGNQSAGGAQMPGLASINQSGISLENMTATKTDGHLTERQLEVLRLVALGKSNKEIGKQLGLAPSTIKTHLEHAREVLGASTRTEASVKARLLNLI